jgi:hypothetical protein
VLAQLGSEVGEADADVRARTAQQHLERLALDVVGDDLAVADDDRAADRLFRKGGNAEEQCDCGDERFLHEKAPLVVMAG